MADAVGLIMVVEQCTADDATRALHDAARLTLRDPDVVADDIVQAAQLAERCLVTTKPSKFPQRGRFVGPE